MIALNAFEKLATPSEASAVNCLALHAQGLSRRFGKHWAVKNVDICLPQRQVLGFLGPNGAGKTTTLQMLTGNLAPHSGSVRLCGVDLIRAPRKAKSHLGYLPEIAPLYKELRVTEYLRWVARLHRIPRALEAHAIDQALERCKLTTVSTTLIAHLSKGFQQRVGIAQAIIHEPDVIILDEPTVGLDPNQIRDIRTLIRELGQTHSLIISTHLLSEVEAVCDAVLIMHQGDMVFNDTLERFNQNALNPCYRLVRFEKIPPFTKLPQGLPFKTLYCVAPHLFYVRFLEAIEPQTHYTQCTQWALESGLGPIHLYPEIKTLEALFSALTPPPPELRVSP